MAPPNTNTIRVLWYGNERENRILTDALIDYRQAHPESAVELIIVPQHRHVEILSRMVAAGQAPDLARLTECNTTASPFREQAADISRHFTTEELKGFLPSRLAQCRIESLLAGLPLTCHTLVTFYNRDALGRVGADAPATVYDTWTAEDFAATAQKLQSRGGMKYGWAAARDDEIVQSVDRMFGGPAGIAWFISQHIGGIAPRSSWMAHGPPAASIFLRGQCGMLIDWSSRGRQFEDQIRGFSWDVTYLPRAERPMAAITGDNWVVFSASRIEETIRLLRAVTSTAVLDRWVENGDSLPVRSGPRVRTEKSNHPWQQAAMDQANLAVEPADRENKQKGQSLDQRAVEQAMANFVFTEP